MRADTAYEYSYYTEDCVAENEWGKAVGSTFIGGPIFSRDLIRFYVRASVNTVLRLLQREFRLSDVSPRCPKKLSCIDAVYCHRRNAIRLSGHFS